MIDLLLAVVVVGAVIAFGALISVGNERQRRAIDALHEAHKQWAMQDLRLKRGAVSAKIQIEDHTAWLTRAISLAFGCNIPIMDYQLYNTPVTTLEFHNTEFGTTIVCALESPEILIPLLRKKHAVLRRELSVNPILGVNKRTPSVPLSALNAGIMFDLELPVAWSKLTGQITESNTLWAYVLK